MSHSFEYAIAVFADYPNAQDGDDDVPGQVSIPDGELPVATLNRLAAAGWRVVAWSDGPPAAILER